MSGEESRAAGRTTTSMHYKEPSIRISKTYQDSNIFGYKDCHSATLTDTTRKEMQRPTTALRDTAAQKSHMNQIFATDDKVARQKLRKAVSTTFEPTFDRSSPIKRKVNEFYGEQYGEGYEGARAQSPLSKSSVASPKSAYEMKVTQQQSSIFSDERKVIQVQEVGESQNRERLVSASSKWDSRDSHKKANNLRKSEDLSNSQLTSFAQNRKKRDMHSDIFNSSPRKEEQAGFDCEQRPQAGTMSARFADKKDEGIKRTQHMFSNILGHEDKNYDYTKTQNTQGDPVIPTNLPWHDSRTEQLSPTKNPDQTATERKMATLGNSVESAMNTSSPTKQPATVQAVSEKALEREMLQTMSPQQKKGFEMKSEVPLGDNSQSWTNTRPATSGPTHTFDFDLKSIPKGMDLETLKQTFAGYHVVELNSHRDNVSGSTLGSGRVKIRANTSHDLLKLKHDLKSKGVLMLSHFEKHNKKNNYRDLAKITWNDQRLQTEEGRLKCEFESPLESKLRNLESEGDVFGSSKGVGKWNRATVNEQIPKTKTSQNGEQKSQKDMVKSLQWKNAIKKVPTTARSSTAVKGKASLGVTRPK